MTATEQATELAQVAARAASDKLATDIVLIDVSDRLARDTPWFGVVALFHAPAEHGWRAVFSAADVEQAGVTVGLHACALTAGTGAAPAGDGVKPLSLVHCQ